VVKDMKQSLRRGEKPAPLEHAPSRPRLNVEDMSLMLEGSGLGEPPAVTIQTLPIGMLLTREQQEVFGRCLREVEIGAQTKVSDGDGRDDVV
jgi:hypothetical protein